MSTQVFCKIPSYLSFNDLKLYTVNEMIELYWY